MSLRAAVPALYLCGFTSLPCILASCMVLTCAGVQSNMRWPNLVSLLSTRDIENWQISVNWGVTCACLAWLFMSHSLLRWSAFIPRLPALVRGHHHRRRCLDLSFCLGLGHRPRNPPIPPPPLVLAPMPPLVLALLLPLVPALPPLPPVDGFFPGLPLPEPPVLPVAFLPTLVPFSNAKPSLSEESSSW